jgi:hypothetical protein
VTRNCCSGTTGYRLPATGTSTCTDSCNRTKENWRQGGENTRWSTLKNSCKMQGFKNYSLNINWAKAKKIRQFWVWEQLSIIEMTFYKVTSQLDCHLAINPKKWKNPVLSSITSRSFHNKLNRDHIHNFPKSETAKLLFNTINCIFLFSTMISILFQRMVISSIYMI